MIKTLLLILILLLAGFTAFIPHIGYAYPLHVDEWMHLTYAKTIAQTGAISFPDPFTGEGTVGPGTNVWLGYHIIMATVQKVSGIDWLVLWRFGPSVIFMLTVFCVYVFANKQGYGLEAAFFTCLIPTTGGLLGPAFMVPMALGLLFIPLSLYIAFYIKSWLSYLLLFIITCFLWSMHPTTAAIQGIVLLPFILINLKGNARRSLGLLAALLLPVLIALPFTINQFLLEMGQLLSRKEVFPPPYLDLPAVLQIYGFIPLIFCFIGIIYLLKRGGKSSYALILALVLLLGVMLAFARFQVGMDSIFVRGVSTALLLIGIIAGAGLYWLRTQALSAPLLDKYKPRFAVYAGGLLAALAVIVILAIAIPARFNVPYYHMIDDEDYRAFIWIRDNIAPEYESALVDPWTATAFTAVTAKKVAHRIWEKEELPDILVNSYMQSGCAGIAFLLDNRLSFIYSRLPVNNPDLITVRANVFITDPARVDDMYPSDGLQNEGFESVRGSPPESWLQWAKDCDPAFLFPRSGRDGGACIGICMAKNDVFNKRPIATWSQNVPVHEGTTYQIGGWIRTEEITGQGGARIAVHWRAPGNIFINDDSFMEYLQGNNDWAYYHGHITAPPAATICNIGAWMADCSGTAFYDDIFFKPE